MVHQCIYNYYIFFSFSTLECFGSNIISNFFYDCRILFADIHDYFGEWLNRLPNIAHYLPVWSRFAARAHTPALL